MSPEFPPERDPGWPRRFVEPGPGARGFLERVLADLDDLEAELRVVQGASDHGAGFVAWLRLGDTAPREPTLIPRYEQSYAGAWQSIDQLADHHIDALGWGAELAELVARNAIPEGSLRWDYPVISARLHEMYDFVELDGLTHAFYR